MQNLRRHLPSLNHLYAVEAVGRLLSFTRAADELGITQPAVSKSIRATEETLGFALFERKHRGLDPTEKGAVFIAETRAMLGRLSGTIEDLTRTTDKPLVRVCFSTSFVSLWLVPRVVQFSAAFPEIDLHIEESSSDQVDLTARRLDFSARLGDGSWEGIACWHLTDEEIGAVGSPEFARNQLSSPTLDALAQSNLIHVSEPQRTRLSWQGWFQSLGFPPPAVQSGLTFSDYHSAVDAALRGQGAVLGWRHLVGQKIADGDLVWLGDHRVRTGQSIYLIAPETDKRSHYAEAFKDWVLDHFQ